MTVSERAREKAEKQLAVSPAFLASELSLARIRRNSLLRTNMALAGSRW